MFEKEQKVVKFIISLMIKKHIILPEQQEIYEYGLECLLLKLVHLFTYLFIAIYLDSLLQFILLWIVFGSLRKHAGGFHANTRIGCYILSCIIVFGFLLISHIYFNSVIVKIGMGISNIIIWKYAPVINGNMDLDEWEKLYYKRKSRKILLVLDVVFIICFIFRIEVICNIIMESCLLMSGVLLLGVLKTAYINYRIRVEGMK